MRWGLLPAFVSVLALFGVASADGPVRRPARAIPSRAARPAIPAGYFYEVRALHTPSPSRSAPIDISGRPELVLRSAVTNESEAFQAAGDAGGFALADLPRVAHIMREPSTGHEFPIDRGLLDALYKIQRRFDAQELRIISAYRTPVEGNGQGNHGRGRACDFVVPGAEDADVARFAREMGFVGVGLYPIGSFVHVDVRPRSYFWIDRSGPGHRSRERGILLDVAERADDSARRRHEEPPEPFVARAVDMSQIAAPESDEDDE